VPASFLKRARASRSSGQWKDEDYDALADGKVVGRILEAGSRFGMPGLQWGRSTTKVVRVPDTHARALKQAKANCSTIEHGQNGLIRA
jgi:hypothetical protein